MKKIISIFILCLLVFGLGWFANTIYQNYATEPNPINPVIPKPLEKYTFEKLMMTVFEKGDFQIGEEIEEEENYTSSLFSFKFKPDPENKETKMTTGQINMPTAKGEYPIIVMLRGYVDQQIYTTGIGTRKSAAVFADNGYITIAPDFLGYADSDPQADNIFESRFQTYTAVLTLLKSLDSVPNWDGENIFLWGHSNGGQIAITILEITGKEYPTVLWAPVTKPFPYSILYYTDESEDRGKYIRRELAKFENLYSVEKYSLDNYLENISAPIQLHQGTADDAVPLEWANQFADSLEELEKDLDYYVYPGADHNMVPSWNTVVARNLSFFDLNLQ